MFVWTSLETGCSDLHSDTGRRSGLLRLPESRVTLADACRMRFRGPGLPLLHGCIVLIHPVYVLFEMEIQTREVRVPGVTAPTGARSARRSERQRAAGGQPARRAARSATCSA
jgi:hypothetical protein